MTHLAPNFHAETKHMDSFPLLFNTSFSWFFRGSLKDIIYSYVPLIQLAGLCAPSLANNGLDKLCLSSLKEINSIFKLNICSFLYLHLEFMKEYAQVGKKSAHIYSKNIKKLSR